MKPLASLLMKTSTAARGPRPPALVCHVCGATIVDDFTNPMLETAKRLGYYTGEVTGGLGACPRCTVKHDARLKTFTEPATLPAIVGVPEREAESTLANFARRKETKAALDAATDWLETRDRDLYLFGPTGTGKTRLAISLLNDAARRGLVRGDVIYVRVPTLIARLKAAFGQRDADEGSKMPTYLAAALLVLDDLGAEHGTDYTRTQIEGLYNDRIDAGRPTILASNLPLGLSLLDQAKAPADRKYRMALPEFLNDERLTSRIAGFAQIVEMDGDDQRLAGWKQRRRKV